MGFKKIDSLKINYCCRNSVSIHIGINLCSAVALPADLNHFN